MIRMTVALYTHTDMLGHRPGKGHVDQPARLTAVLGALESASGLERRDAPLITVEDLRCVHGADYVAAITDSAPRTGRLILDVDTIMSPGSLAASLRAAGAVVQAVRDVAAGKSDRAFCAVRPPGHHAEPNLPMGFCIFSNVALGAVAAQAAGFQRVAVVDFDVHHGNGTQAVLGGREGMFFASVQQWPMWPGTGHPSESVPGNVRNAIVPPGAAREVWRKAFESLMPGLDAFEPDLVLVSAGFDAHVNDPVGDSSQSLEAEDFAWATRAIATIARRTARGRIVSSLEGGYGLENLGRSSLAHVRALADT